MVTSINPDKFDAEVAKASEYKHKAGALAKRVGAADRTALRFAREKYGKTVRQLLNDNRMTRAPSLMKEHQSAKRVAAELGFYDDAAFSRAYQRIYHMTPIEHLRAQVANGPSSSHATA